MNTTNLPEKSGAPSCLRPAEWVFPGHPDKLADTIAETIVYEAFKRQREALCGIEVAVHRDAVYLTGRLACEGAKDIDIDEVVREVYRSAGYGKRWRPAPEEIKAGGNLCIESLTPGEQNIRHIADDQAIVVGYAANLPGTNFLPPEQWLVRELARELYSLVDSPLELCPDGKVLLVLEEGHDGRRLHSVSASLLAPDDISGIELQRVTVHALERVLERAVKAIPDMVPSLPHRIVVNGGGAFVTGGPEGDNGLSGKKLLMDFYGPRVPIGGGAIFGKDPWRPDRAGAEFARLQALQMVKHHEHQDATVTLCLFPGDETVGRIEVKAANAIVSASHHFPFAIQSALDTSLSLFSQLTRESMTDRVRWGWR